MSSTHVVLAVRNPTQVYAYVRRQLENGNRVTYLTTLSGADLIANISKYWSGVCKYNASQQLSIRPAHDFFPRDTGHDVAGKISHSRSAKSPESNRDAIVILCPAAVMAYLETSLHTPLSESTTTDSKVNTIMEFEILVSKRFSDSTVVCCLFDRFVQTLDLVHLLILVKYHSIAIGHGGKIIPVREHDIVDAIKRGIDVSMGKGYSTIILKTLQYVYGIDESAIFRDPVEWSNMIRKACSPKGANLILNAVTEEVRRLIMQ